MSIKLMSKVWDLPKTIIKTPSKFLLLALCDYANDDGDCYPSQDKLMLRTGMGETALRDNLKWLESMGVVCKERRQKGGRRFSDLYRIDLSPLYKSEPLESEGTDIAKTVKSEPSHSEGTPKVNPRIPSCVPSHSEGCYISGTPIEPSMIDIQTGVCVLSLKQIADWVIARGWSYGINTSNPALVEAVALGITESDLNYALAEMNANNAGTNWRYFCKTVRTAVQHRLQDAQALPTPTAAVERKKPSQTNTTDTDVALLVANGVGADVASQWVAYCQTRKAGMLTQVFLDNMKQEGLSKGLKMSLADVVAWCLGNRQVRFQAEWLVKSVGGSAVPQGVAYREFEAEPVVSDELKHQRHQEGKRRSAELVKATAKLLAGKVV